MNLEALEHLNQEIVALARAGVPLETGLREFAREGPRWLRPLHEDVAQRMQQGASLPAALQASDQQIPEIYRAVVTAGLRSGHLPRALEGIATTLRRVRRVRDQLAAALVYPLVVLATASVLFFAVTAPMLTRVETAFTQQQVTIGPFVQTILWLCQAYRPLALPVCIVLIGLAMCVWWWSGRAVALDSRFPWSFVAWFPAARRMLRAGQQAIFTELLRALLQHQLPADQALMLASRATGARGLIADAGDLAAALQQASHTHWRSGRRDGVSDWTGWLLTSGTRPADLDRCLAVLSEHYEQEAQDEAQRVRVLLPIGATVLLGGSIATLYGAVVLIPWTALLRQLTLP